MANPFKKLMQRFQAPSIEEKRQEMRDFVEQDKRVHELTQGTPCCPIQLQRDLTKAERKLFPFYVIPWVRVECNGESRLLGYIPADPMKEGEQLKVKGWNDRGLVVAIYYPNGDIWPDAESKATIFIEDVSIADMESAKHGPNIAIRVVTDLLEKHEPPLFPPEVIHQ